MEKPVIWIGLIVVIIGGLLFWNTSHKPSSISISSSSTPNPTTLSTLSPKPTPTPNLDTLANPTAEFKPRITKKFFGTFVTPQNSPVQPERFTGFHAGVDIEYGDVNQDVPVFAIADGQIVTSESASGYGGVMVEKFEYKGQSLYAIYGHIRLSSAKKSGAVKKGEQIAVLGTAYSSETDGERRHLHFGIATQNTILGYVQTKAALSPTFIDPLSLYP